MALPVCVCVRFCQTGLYCDFFYHYYQSKRGGMNRPVKLPV